MGEDARRATELTGHELVVNSNELIKAAAAGHHRKVALLLPVSDPVHRGGQGLSALLCAAKNNHPLCVAALIDASDLEARDGGGATALHWCARHGNNKGVAALLDKGGVDLARLVDHRNQSALHWAADVGDAATIKTLIPYCDIDAGDRRSETPLMMAAVRGHTQAVETLLEGGADAKAKDVLGYTALMKATGHGDTACLNSLIGHSDVDAMTRQGYTALMEAALSSAGAGVQALLPCCNVKLRNADGFSAADVARHVGHHGVADRIEAYVLACEERAMISEASKAAVNMSKRVQSL